MDCKHVRLACPSPIPRAYSNSRSSSQWCHPTISFSVVPVSFCLQSFPASRSFQMSQLFPAGGQNIGASASALVLPMNIQDWSPLGWTGWISLQSKWLSRVFSSTTVQKHQLLGAQLFFSIHDYWKTVALTRWTFVDITLCLCFLICSLGCSKLFFQGVSVFLFHGCSHHLQWFWSPQNKVCHCFHCFPTYLP